MKWKQPPIIKIYEALGSIADGRIEINGEEIKVYSSSGNKYYDVRYDHGKKSIMTNDNGSFWKGYLGYPAIAYLLKIGILPYEEDLAILLKGIMWKDINQKFKNDFDKTLQFILNQMNSRSRLLLEKYVEKVMLEIVKNNFSMLGPKQKPPEGY